MPTVTGKITRVTVAADNWNSINNPGIGFFYIYMDQLPVTTPGGYRRVAIRSTHPTYSQLVIIAMSAQSRGAIVELNYLPTNIARSNSWDFGVLDVKS